ncbi:MAG TPA: translation initiation factor IF-3, partial [Gammaproteobacteria bacterium]|nr:translation initiation factor IF-3 [Gammaproteobacteria bacterium]
MNIAAANRLKHRLNHNIEATEVRVVGAEGEQLGVITLEEAQKIADEANLDLVEISPQAEPPVCKVMD